MIAALAIAAWAEPPRGEIIAGWAGNAGGGYGYLLAMPSLARNDEASLVLRGGVSWLTYHYFDGPRRVDVDSPGVSLGLGFKYAPATVSFGMGVGIEETTTIRKTSSDPHRSYQFGGTVSSDLYWRPERRYAVYAIGSFSAANQYLWGRVGAMHQVIPRLKRGAPASLWLGLDGTGSGNSEIRTLEAGADAELQVRDLHGSLSARGGFAVEDAGDRTLRQGTLGLGLYWAY